MNYAVAVIDIGMTNKKVAVYDENLHQLDAVYKTFEPLKVREPDTGTQVEAHDLAGMEDWFFEQLRTFAQKYPIKALSVTTHGATFVCIDKDGKVCVPSILYTHEPGEQFQNEFYKKCGSKADLQRSTYTPPFGSLINPAKGIMYLQKHFAAEFAKTRTILNFPQYWGYVFTGIAGTEPAAMMTAFASCTSPVSAIFTFPAATSSPVPVTTSTFNRFISEATPEHSVSTVFFFHAAISPMSNRMLSA